MNFAEFVAILSGNNDLLNKTKLDNKIMQLEKEQAIFKKERIRAERKIAAGQGEIEKAKRTEANLMRDLEYINSYNGTKATLLLSLPQATTAVSYTHLATRGLQVSAIPKARKGR